MDGGRNGVGGCGFIAEVVVVGLEVVVVVGRGRATRGLVAVGLVVFATANHTHTSI